MFKFIMVAWAVYVCSGVVFAYGVLGYEIESRRREGWYLFMHM
jgi:hypothetical protein